MTEAVYFSITPDQMRNARTSLGWTRQSLSFASGVTVHFISVYEESGRVGRLYLRRPGFDAMTAIRTALEAVGIEFTAQSEGGAGIRMRKAEG